MQTPVPLPNVEAENFSACNYIHQEGPSSKIIISVDGPSI